MFYFYFIFTLLHHNRRDLDGMAVYKYLVVCMFDKSRRGNQTVDRQSQGFNGQTEDVQIATKQLLTCKQQQRLTIN